MLNRIVTNGFGRSRGAAGRAGPVTMGYGGFAQPTPPTPVDTGVPRRARGNGTKQGFPGISEAFVWARLVEHNGRAPTREIKGSVRIPLDAQSHRIKALVEHVGTKKRDNVRVTVVRSRNR